MKVLLWTHENSFNLGSVDKKFGSFDINDV